MYLSSIFGAHMLCVITYIFLRYMSHVFFNTGEHKNLELMGEFKIMYFERKCACASVCACVGVCVCACVCV